MLIILLRSRTLEMVLSAEKRKALATRLNNMVDIPFLNESQEQMIAESIINAMMSPLESAMPSDAEMTQMARSSGEESMQKTVKAKVVEKINTKINLPVANEEQEALLFGMIVDFVLKDKFDEIHRSLSSGSAVPPGDNSINSPPATSTGEAQAQPNT